MIDEMPGDPPDNARHDEYGRWVGVAEAATILHVHPRTVERRIDSERLRSRKVNGAREIWIAGHTVGQMPGPDNESDGVSGNAGQGDETALVTYRQLAGPAIAMAREMADVADARVADAKVDARRARRWGAVAWSMLGIMIVAGMVGTWFSTQQITAGRQQVVAVSGTLVDTASRLKAMADELDGAQAEGVRLAKEAARTAAERDQTAAEAGRLRSQVGELQAMLAALEAEKAVQANQGPGWGWWGVGPLVEHSPAHPAEGR